MGILGNVIAGAVGGAALTQLDELKKQAEDLRNTNLERLRSQLRREDTDYAAGKAVSYVSQDNAKVLTGEEFAALPDEEKQQFRRIEAAEMQNEAEQTKWDRDMKEREFGLEKQKVGIMGKTAGSAAKGEIYQDAQGNQYTEEDVRAGKAQGKQLFKIGSPGSGGDKNGLTDYQRMQVVAKVREQASERFDDMITGAKDPDEIKTLQNKKQEYINSELAAIGVTGNQQTTTDPLQAIFDEAKSGGKQPAKNGLLSGERNDAEQSANTDKTVHEPSKGGIISSTANTLENGQESEAMKRYKAAKENASGPHKKGADLGEGLKTVLGVDQIAKGYDMYQEYVGQPFVEMMNEIHNAATRRDKLVILDMKAPRLTPEEYEKAYNEIMSK